MSHVEKKLVSINIVDVGKFEAELPRINAPLTIQHFMNSLPLKARGIQQGSRFVIPTSLKTSPERPKSTFAQGDISIDASSGNITIYLKSIETFTKETYIGSIITGYLDISQFKSTGVIIKSV